MVAATVLPLSQSASWSIRIFDFPRVHVAVVATLTFVLLPLIETPMTVGTWILLSALVAVIVMQAYWIYPYTILVSPEVENSRDRGAEIRLMIANVLITNRRFSLLADHLARYDPDILLAVEVNEWWAKQLESLHPRFPYQVSYPLDNSYGISLHSKLELADTEVRFLVQDDIPSIRTKVKLKSDALIEFYGVHPRPPAPDKLARSTERDAELILIGQECESRKLPVIVAGDLNDVAWSYTTLRFRKISRMLDPRVGRGFFATFHAKLPFFRWPLDHVFHSDHFRLVDMKVLPQFGSDHLPVFIHLSYEPNAEFTQEGPERPDSEEGEKARETVERAQKSN
ncbi:MAG TPA: endonuclease/exonuclease/phosphatase family protein [Candidatus Binatia bacterium]|nr:endonuclease/exonuclease/phosphatase family protein [Candidatus Binatia bacterium]